MIYLTKRRLFGCTINNMAIIVCYDCSAIDAQQLDSLLAKTGHEVEYIKEKLSVANVRPDADVISVFVTSRVDQTLMAMMPKLRLIACRSTGYNHVDVRAATTLGITVANVPTYGEQTVAEYVFTLLLALSRRLVPTLQAVEQAIIDQPQLTGWDLQGKTLGVLGTGHIGQCVARIAVGFGMHVVAYDPYPNHQQAKTIGFRYMPAVEVVKQSDVLSLHMPYTSENHHFVDRSLLTQCKRGMLLINTARGELVDTQALIDALQSGYIAGAGLDVLEGEELLHGSEEELLLRQPALAREALEHSLRLHVLARMPAVILTPHNAFNTIEAIGRINQVTAQNVLQFIAGQISNKVEATV